MNHVKLNRDITAWRKTQTPPLTLKKVATMLGYSRPQFVSAIVNGKKPPSKQFWIMIEHLTDGLIRQENYHFGSDENDR